MRRQGVFALSDPLRDVRAAWDLRTSVIIGGVRLRDERYLFHLRPWAYFPLWFALGIGLGWILDAAPFWLRVLIIAPVGWTLPFYVARMPWVTRLGRWRRRPEGGSAER